MIVNFPYTGKSQLSTSHVTKSKPVSSNSVEHKSHLLLKARPSLFQLAQNPDLLPDFVRQDRVAMNCLDLLGPLDWDNFPERDPNRPWPGSIPNPRAAYVAALIIKTNKKMDYMTELRNYLLDHPALIWLFSFKLCLSDNYLYGFDPEKSLPTARHFGRVLRELPQEPLQFLLDSSVELIKAELPDDIEFGDIVAGDTKHIPAWVKENNPKAYVKEYDRLNKKRQPIGDPDCKLGCKRKHNSRPRKDKCAVDQLDTISPDDFTQNDRKKGKKRATQFSSDRYFWGYNSGVIATKVPDYGEFVLAELTLTFEKGDTHFFFPMMAAVERRLGQKPTFGAFDGGFEAFYIFDYFDRAGGFAAIPFSLRGKLKRNFDENGLPICQAGFPMPLKGKFWSKSSHIIEHEKGRYACPLLFPEPTGETCLIDHHNWPKGGCVTTMPTCNGSRVRYQLDRKSDEYKNIYKQRTSTERINSQAEALGIETPKLRRGTAIANRNTLIYVLINLRAVHRIRKKRAESRFLISD
jgi:hypothetical protein